MTSLFERNENGLGFKPTARGHVLLRVWDLLSWIAAAWLFGTLLTTGSAPVWLYVLVAPFFIAPFFIMMFFSRRGPIGALLHFARLMRNRRRS